MRQISAKRAQVVRQDARRAGMDAFRHSLSHGASPAALVRRRSATGAGAKARSNRPKSAMNQRKSIAKSGAAHRLLRRSAHGRRSNSDSRRKREGHHEIRNCLAPGRPRFAARRLVRGLARPVTRVDVASRGGSCGLLGRTTQVMMRGAERRHPRPHAARSDASSCRSRRSSRAHRGFFSGVGALRRRGDELLRAAGLSPLGEPELRAR
jgi:hypothetical protein